VITLLTASHRALVICLTALASGAVLGFAPAMQQPTPAAAPPTSGTPQSVLGATPAPQGVPAPAPATAQPYAPQAILPGGIVVTIYPPGSPRLNAERVMEAEVYSMTRGVPGRIASIVNIHNPSVELHRVPEGMNTGVAVIVVAGGGHNTLNVGSEGSDFVPFFYNYGINTIILRNRLRRDGYDPQKDAVADLLQAIKVVRAYASDWAIDPRKIGAIGFSAGAELTSHAAVKYIEFDKAEDVGGNPLSKVTSRPDFIGLIYPGPTPFRGAANLPIPDDAPASFIASGGVGDANHAAWADEYFAAFLRARIPNLEMHIYGNGRHPGDPLPEGGTMTGGLTDRGNLPLGTWQYRFIDWFRDLGFLQKPGVETKAARDVATHVANPPSPATSTGPEAGEWVSLFDGKTLTGWQTTEHPETWTVSDGALVTKGERSHLYYVGPVADHAFKNFELSAEVMTAPGSNSGIYVHTSVQGPGFPAAGYELQVINSNPPVTGAAYVEHKMTGSIYAVRNNWKAPVPDNQWFTYRIRVVGKTIQTYINDALVCEYTEPANPWRPDDKKGRLLGSGTFALQGHDPGSVVRFRALRVRVLPADLPTPGTPLDDRELDQLITSFSNDNVPLIDLGLVPPASRADVFWAEARRYGVAPATLFPPAALSRQNTSIVIVNDRDRPADPAQLQRVKAAGAKIAFSSGGATTLDPARLKRRLLAIKAAGLTWQDFWVPGKN
jgi:acetyl esterase/lipase